MNHFKEYLIIGGMPAAISSWKNKKSLKEVNQVHHDLMATYRDDIAKYRGRLAAERLEEVMLAVPKHLGEKFVYTRINPSAQISTIKHALDLLCKAKICHRVVGCAANGVPLAAEIQERYVKAVFLDVGLCSAALGLSLDQLSVIEEVTLINKGGIAEQVVGQILRTIVPPYIEPALYYWHREEKGSSAEVDYMTQYRNRVIPIEVKAGSTGSLRSLQFFMCLKGLPIAVRINSDCPSQVEVILKEHQYKLLSIPFYLLGQLHRFLDEEPLK
jgi:predicted AAA+ superfamily ATPase